MLAAVNYDTLIARIGMQSLVAIFNFTDAALDMI
jgi:hypothetical protein